MGVSKNRGGPPKWMVYIGKPYSNGWFGGTTIFGNIQILPKISPFRLSRKPNWLNWLWSHFWSFPTSHDEQKIVPSSKQQWLGRVPMKRLHGESVSTASRWIWPFVLVVCVMVYFLNRSLIIYTVPKQSVFRNRKRGWPGCSNDGFSSEVSGWNLTKSTQTLKSRSTCWDFACRARVVDWTHPCGHGVMTFNAKHVKICENVTHLWAKHWHSDQRWHARKIISKFEYEKIIVEISVILWSSIREIWAEKILGKIPCSALDCISAKEIE